MLSIVFRAWKWQKLLHPLNRKLCWQHSDSTSQNYKLTIGNITGFNCSRTLISHTTTFFIFRHNHSCLGPQREIPLSNIGYQQSDIMIKVISSTHGGLSVNTYVLENWKCLPPYSGARKMKSGNILRLFWTAEIAFLDGVAFCRIAFLLVLLNINIKNVRILESLKNYKPDTSVNNSFRGLM